MKSHAGREKAPRTGRVEAIEITPDWLRRPAPPETTTALADGITQRPMPEPTRLPAPIVTMIPAVNGSGSDLLRWRSRAEQARWAPGHVVGVWRPLLVTEQLDDDAEGKLDEALRAMQAGRAAALIVGLGGDGELVPLAGQELQTTGDAVEMVAQRTRRGFRVATTVFSVPVLVDCDADEQDDEDAGHDETDEVGAVMLFTFEPLTS